MARDRPSPYEEMNVAFRRNLPRLDSDSPAPYEERSPKGMARDRPSPYEERSGVRAWKARLPVGQTLALRVKEERNIIGTTSNFCPANRRGTSLYSPGLPS